MTRVRRGALVLLAAILTLATTGWLQLLHAVQGAHEAGEPEPLWHLLRDSALAAPVVLVAVLVALKLSLRLLLRAGLAPGSGVSTFLVGSLCAFAASAALGLGSPVHALLFEAREAHGMTALEHLLRDVLLSLSMSLPVALIVVALLRGRLWSHPGSATPSERVLFRSAVRQATAAAAAVVLASAGVVSPVEAPSALAAAVGPCPAGAPVKSFDVTAIDITMWLDRFGTHDPLAQMYVPTSMIPAARAQEAAGPGALSLGIGDDPIQPLVIRANQGDCVVIDYTNSTTRPAPRATSNEYGLHIDGLAFEMDSSGDAIGNNPSSSVAPGGSTTYTYWIPNDPRLEGAHYIHPGPGNRQAVAHGLFGTLSVQPEGSTYLNPTTGAPQTSGWEAMIVPGTGKAFRENVKIFHEIGNEAESEDDGGGGVPVDLDGLVLKTIDPHTGAYRPGARAMNYRSESFMVRLDNAEDQKSTVYGSYTFGDTSNPISRGYLADPTKFRVVHAGSEVFHVYHLHGGADRWPQNPKADPTADYGATGLNKHPVGVQGQTARLDSQSMGPGETYSMEIENGAGGAQQGAGEFLFHCHIAHHYFAGMWGMWRVYDTLQPDLMPLPDRQPLSMAVDSSGLTERTINGQTITADNLDAWIRPQLPTQGVTRAIQNATRDDADQDASVWDWAIDPETGLYLGEPDRAFRVREGALSGSPWPNFHNVVPGHPSALLIDQTVQSSYLLDGGRVTFDAGGYVGDRPKLLFDPVNGRPAFPMLRPHIGKRPPFAPNGHSGAPYLGETGNQAPDPALSIDPWANRADGICPARSPVRPFNVVGIPVPIPVSDPGKSAKLVDPLGALFVLAEDKAAVYAGTKSYAGSNHREPLALRGNIGDCIALTYVSEMTDGGDESPFSKSNIHVHHVQFDTQGSDGVVAGFSYEQSVRPYKVVDPQLTNRADAGDTVLRLTSVAKFQPGVWIAVGMGTDAIEIRQIASVDTDRDELTLTEPLGNEHEADQWAGTEFVQYRWYPDVQLDNVFFHDHVNGIKGWSHGMVGQFIVEPAGARWFDPVTGEEVRAGAVADIYTDPTCVPGEDPPYLPPGTANQCTLIPDILQGSYREYVLWTVNDHEPAAAEATMNLRAEPPGDRGCLDPSRRFAASCGGDPYTPVFSAYVGDPVVIRNVAVSQGMNTLRIEGHRTYWEPRYRDHGLIESSPVDTIHTGVSERFSLVLDGGAGGPRHVPGDYLYHDGEDRRLRSGGWGILRVLPEIDEDILRPLPDRTTLPAQLPTCAAGAPVRSFDISAVDIPSALIPGDQTGRRAAFVPSSLANDVIDKRLFPEPLVLHAAAGECVEVTLTNRRSLRRASFHVGALLRDLESSGINVGRNPGDQTVAPGESKTYTFFADAEMLQSVAIADFGTVDGQSEGLYGALIVAPMGATFTDPATGLPKDIGSQVDVNAPEREPYRDFTLLLGDQDERIGQDTMPYPEDVDEPALINYQQVTGRPDDADTFSSLVHGDPVTPILRAHAGDPVKVHVIGAPGSEQMHAFNLGGMSWAGDNYFKNSSLLQTRGVGPWEKLDIDVVGGAGGQTQAVGDYFYGDLRRPFTDAGMWGLFRVLPDGCASGDTASHGLRCLGAPPAPIPAESSAPDLAATSDSGRADDDDITNDATPTLIGTATNATNVTIRSDGVVVGTGAVSGGAWSITTSALANGLRSITAQASNAAGNGPQSAALSVRIDTVAPDAPTRTSRFEPQTLGTNTVPVRLEWATSDTAGSGVASYELQRATGATGTFTTQSLPSQAITPVGSIVQQLTPGTLYRYRVRATDIAGNRGAFSAVLQRTVTAAQETSTAITYGGAWSTTTVPGAFGGSVRNTGTAGRTATYSFSGTDVGWVSTRGPARGRAEVRVDGVLKATIDLYAAAAQPRQLVFQQSNLATGSHRLEVRVLGQRDPASTANRVDVDAFVRLN